MPPSNAIVTPHPRSHALSARRGSMSAPDPLGTRATTSPRSSMSRLTLVRVLPPAESMDQAAGSTRKYHARQGSGPASPTRMSFASSSFSSPRPSQSPTLSGRGASPSPASPSRMSFASASLAAPGRPQSPTLSSYHRRSSSAASTASMSRYLQRLSPIQIYDLANVSLHPTASVLNTGHTSPASFTELADDVYLPFLDRPSEVHALVSNVINAKIMALFAQILPPASDRSFPCSSADLALSPEKWTFEDLKYWLSQVPRTEVIDVVWVRTLRRFILPKSEVLWERMKGMLGVPPELDADSPHFCGTPAEHALTIDQIHPVPFSPSAHLDDISEAAEDGSGASALDSILGLRISTSLSFAPVPASPTSLHSRKRTTSQGSIPAKSSPLVPKPQIMLSSPQASSVGFLQIGTEQRTVTAVPPKRQAACPMFPSSFDKLGTQPTPLSVK